MDSSYQRSSINSSFCEGTEAKPEFPYDKFNGNFAKAQEYLSQFQEHLKDYDAEDGQFKKNHIFRMMSVQKSLEIHVKLFKDTEEELKKEAYEMSESENQYR